MCVQELFTLYASYNWYYINVLNGHVFEGPYRFKKPLNKEKFSGPVSSNAMIIENQLT